MINVGDRGRKAPMWKYDSATGTVTKITSQYTVVSWDNINGEWHYTQDQTMGLEVINEQEPDKP